VTKIAVILLDQRTARWIRPGSAGSSTGCGGGSFEMTPAKLRRSSSL